MKQILKFFVLFLSLFSCSRSNLVHDVLPYDSIASILGHPLDSLVALDDTTCFVRFSRLKFRGMTLDSVKDILGAPDYMYGEKVVFGDTYNDIGPLFESDSLVIFRRYVWGPCGGGGMSLVLYYELTRNYSKIDTPFWGYSVDWSNVN